MWRMGDCQCFSTPEVSASFGDHETLDISLDVGSLAKKILTDLISTSEQLPICVEDKKYCLATLETCVNTDSLIQADKLDFFGEKIAVDFTYANGHCHCMQATARVDTSQLSQTLGTNPNL